MKEPPSRRKKTERTILLKDLVPRADPKGGAGGKTVFGQLPPVSEAEERRPEPTESQDRQDERDGRPPTER